jgi:CRISPR-associated protein (TIGR03986 family)
MSLQEGLKKAAQDLKLAATERSNKDTKNDPPRTEKELAPLRHSAVVKSLDRAGRAPYNFVPLPTRPKWYHAPPPRDRFYLEPERYSGHIDLEITALSRFYIRGMRTIQEFTEDSAKERNKQRVQRPLPFTTCEGQVTIPGSSLRGMVRTMVEILGASPLDPINSDHQLFYRAVAADDSPRMGSFDPNAVAYKKRLSAGGGRHDDPARPIARAGYVTGSAGAWTITPAQDPGWYRVETTVLDEADAYHNEARPPVPIWFEAPPKEEVGEYHNHRGTFYKLRIVRKISRQPVQGYQCGQLVRSEFMKGKYMQWIVGPKGNGKVTMDRQDVDAYLFDAQRHSDAPQKFSDAAEHVPCFYVTWKDFSGREHVSIGHTGYFRLPYEKLVGMANPCGREQGEQRWDLAQAIFGRTRRSSGTNKRSGAATRVFFEDATAVNAKLSQEIDVVLGSPKLTTYENYLRQEDNSIENSIHWDGQCKLEEEKPVVRNPDKAVVRGWKGYMHRGDDAPFQKVGDDPRQKDQSKVSTKFVPCAKDTALTSRIRFTSLDPVELGALLTALDLPDNHAHKIGMAKSLGFGSIRVATRLTLIDRDNRYSGFFTACPDGSILLRTGARSANSEETRFFKKKFARWALSDEKLEQDLWTLLDSGPGDETERERLLELRALMQFGPPKGRSWSEWQNATRYLEFGSFDLSCHGEPKPYAKVQYNEYKNIGYDDNWRKDNKHRPTKGRWCPDPSKVTPEQPRRIVESRRPLPPASQVAALDKNIPTDPRPPFGQYFIDPKIAPKRRP